MKKLGLLILLVALLTSGCGTQNTANKNTQPVSAIEKNQEVFIMVGKVEANTEVNISSKIPAKVTGVNVDVGDKVKEGQPLVSLDVKDIQAAVKQAEAGVSTAKAALQNAKKSIRPEQIMQQKAAIASLKIAYDTAAVNLQRSKELFAEGSIPQQQLETVKLQFAQAESQYNAAQDQLEMLQKGATKENLNIYQSQVNQAEAALEVVKTQLRNATVTAPISGVVTAKKIHQGEMAGAGVPLLTVVSDKDIFVNAQAPISVVDKLKTGDKVVLKIETLEDQRFEGEITLINPVIDTMSKKVNLKIKITTANNLIKPGLIAEVALKK